ncbi:MAG: hypothetical protein IKG19_05350, partial [Lachnospiraceae bacterium]|nr:hypothetical protein [Lachnospiraceae bacterium]
MKNKYNEIMDRVKVDAVMWERVLRALEQEDAGAEPGAAEVMEVSRQDAERAEPGLGKQEADRAEPGFDKPETKRTEIESVDRKDSEAENDIKEAQDPKIRLDRKNEKPGDGKKRLSFFGR